MVGTHKVIFFQLRARVSESILGRVHSEVEGRYVTCSPAGGLRRWNSALEGGYLWKRKTLMFSGKKDENLEIIIAVIKRRACRQRLTEKAGSVQAWVLHPQTAAGASGSWLWNSHEGVF